MTVVDLNAFAEHPATERRSGGHVWVRLADNVTISVVSDDAIVERPGQEAVSLDGAGAAVQVLVELLQAPRTIDELSTSLSIDPRTPENLLTRLVELEALVDWDLSIELASLHQRTVETSRWPVASPAGEVSRFWRESAGSYVVRLPEPRALSNQLAQVLETRRTARQFSGRTMSLEQLGTLLALGAGTGYGMSCPAPLVPGGPAAGRTYPSGGALYPVEALVYPLNVDAIEPSFYYYQVLAHRLSAQAPSLPSEALYTMLNEHPVLESNALLLLFIDFTRPSFGKYGGKLYRLALLEAGHIAQNIALVAAALDLGTLAICGFLDEDLALSAGLNYPNQPVVYVLAVGAPAATD